MRWHDDAALERVFSRPPRRLPLDELAAQLLVAQGFSRDEASLALILYSLGGAAGSLLGGRVLDSAHRVCRDRPQLRLRRGDPRSARRARPGAPDDARHGDARAASAFSASSRSSTASRRNATRPRSAAPASAWWCRWGGSARWLGPSSPASSWRRQHAERGDAHVGAFHPRTAASAPSPSSGAASAGARLIDPGSLGVIRSAPEALICAGGGDGVSLAPWIRSASSSSTIIRSCAKVIGGCSPPARLFGRRRSRRRGAGLAAFAEHAPDVVLMDLAMPAAAVSPRSRRCWAGSGRADHRRVHAPGVIFARKAMAAGARGFVSKSSPPDELVRAITAVMSGGAHSPPTWLRTSRATPSRTAASRA